jgi:hypothetical protein
MARYWVTIRFTIALRQQQKLGVIRFIKNGKAVNSFGCNCWEVQWNSPLVAALIGGNRILLPVKHVALPTAFLRQKTSDNEHQEGRCWCSDRAFLHLQFNTHIPLAVAHAVLRTSRAKALQ